MSRRIETRTSRTAEMTCLARAISYYERDAMFHSGDWVAPRLLPETLQRLAPLGLTRFVYRHLAPRGIYQYVIARTKYIDAAFAEHLPEVRQVLVFGAGFDSRAIRFADAARHVRYFEIDAPATQAAKIGQLRHRHLDVPANVVFVPVDFEREPVAAKLDAVGCSSAPSLCVLEGLTMYLDAESIRSTFAVIGRYAAKGSIVVLDHIHASVLAAGPGTSRSDPMSRSVARAGELWTFGLPEGGAAAFLAEHDLTLVEELGPADLERRYFTAKSGRTTGSVTPTHGLITARS